MSRMTRPAARSLLAICLLVLCGPGRLAAADGRGAVVIVKMADGSRAQGELARVEPGRLVLGATRSNPERVIDLVQVSTIEILRKRPFEPRFLNGAALGVLLGISQSAADRDFHYDYAPQLAPGLMGLLGFFAGLGLESIGTRSEFISMAGVPSSAWAGTEDRLRRYAREGGGTRRPWLGGVRLSWRPYFHPALPIRLAGHASLSEPAAGTALDMDHPKGQSYPNRRVRFRADYELRPWLWLGLEYVSLGAHNISGWTFPQVVRDNQTYTAGIFASGRVDADAAFMGASLGIPSGPRAELGLGFALCSLKDLGTDEGVMWIGDPAQTLRFKMIPALQFGASWEFSPEDRLSAGFFADYMVLKPSFPGATFNGRLSFFPGSELHTGNPAAFELDAALIFPARKVDLSGFSIGVFLRLK